MDNKNHLSFVNKSIRTFFTALDVSKDYEYQYHKLRWQEYIVTIQKNILDILDCDDSEQVVFVKSMNFFFLNGCFELDKEVLQELYNFYFYDYYYKGVFDKLSHYNLALLIRNLEESEINFDSSRRFKEEFDRYRNEFIGTRFLGFETNGKKVISPLYISNIELKNLIIKNAAESSRKLITADLPRNLGYYILGYKQTDNRMLSIFQSNYREYMQELISDNVSNMEIFSWWNLSNTDRSVIYQFDLSVYQAYCRQRNQGTLIEKSVEDYFTKGIDRSLINNRDYVRGYGCLNPIFKAFEFRNEMSDFQDYSRTDDRPLPYELRERVQKFQIQTHKNENLLNEICRFSSYNAFIRYQVHQNRV
jgi:hypothetical protein